MRFFARRSSGRAVCSFKTMVTSVWLLLLLLALLSTSCTTVAYVTPTTSVRLSSGIMRTTSVGRSSSTASSSSTRLHVVLDPRHKVKQRQGRRQQQQQQQHDDKKQQDLAPSREAQETVATTTTTTAATTNNNTRMKWTDAVAIIAGTATGGGFLALPQVTSPIGYGPTVLGLMLAYAFLTTAALAFCEAAGLAKEETAVLLQQQDKSSHHATTSGTSVAAVIQQAFGRTWAMVAGAGFLTQMVAVLTAQIAKGAELLAYTTTGVIPYRVACILPVTIVATWVYRNSSQRVESVNTALTVVMLAGFGALIAAALARPADLVLSGTADWSRLLPNTETPFALPLFVKLLSFGQAMPLLMERMVMTKYAQNKAESSSLSKVASSSYNQLQEAAEQQQTGAAYRQVRRATVLGAAVPLMLAIIWAGISSALVAPLDPNPIFSLLGSYGPSIAVPVLFLSYGAIGTTLLGSLMALAHFAQEMIGGKVNGNDEDNNQSLRNSINPRWASAASKILAVAVPCTLACIGPSIYLPLLSFAGAYPTTLLYGLAPCLAALVLRRRVEHTKRLHGVASDDEDNDAVNNLTTTPRLVPGGAGTLRIMICAALGLVGSSTTVAIRHLVLRI